METPEREYDWFDENRNPPVKGPLDRFVRRFRVLTHTLAVLVVYALASVALGIALWPALQLGLAVWRASAALSEPLRLLAMGGAAGAGFFLFAITLLIVVPVMNFILPTRIGPFKGGYYTIATLPWFLHNALFYLVRYTVLPFVTLTPFSPLFLRLMGMKFGKRVFINTEQISDPMLISLGDDVAIGGSVHLFAHYGGGGNLVIAPVTIGAGATIGLKATVMGDVQIGPGAVILPHSVLLPGSRVGAREVWGGVPARPLPRADLNEHKRVIRGLEKSSHAQEPPGLG